MNYKSVKIVICFFLLSFFSCNSNPLEVNVENQQVDLKIDRMEKDLFESKLPNMNETNRYLFQKYGSLYEVFVAKMIGEGSIHDPQIGARLQRFVSDSIIQLIYTDIKHEFGDFTAYENEFKEAFKHYKYYFPDSLVPRLVTFYSNFNAKVFPANNTLAIGLDMYLGADNKSVQQIPPDVLPQFIKNDMEKKYLVADAMKYWLLNRFYNEDTGDDFASKIIELGKIMYLLDAMLPHVSDDIKMNYTPEELLWVQQNENNIWKSLIDNKVLYTKNPMLINQYIVDGPFTKGLTSNSPSKVGIWVGWQIVRDYVEQNDVDVLSLLKEKNSIKILKAYKHGK